MRLPGGRRESDGGAARVNRAARPGGRGPPGPAARSAVVYLETTGLDSRHDEIISFASFPIEDGRIVVGKATAATVRPDVMPSAETIRIHGLRAADLEDAPPLGEALDRILEALAGRILVAHAAWVERGFLAAALKTVGLKLADPLLDTAALASQVLGDGGRDEGVAIPLGQAAEAVGPPVHSPHIAAGDALTTAQLFLALATRLDRREPQTVASLAGHSV